MWAGIQDVSSAALLNIKDTSQGSKSVRNATLQPHLQTTIDKLADKVLLRIFSYLPHVEIGRLARVCKKWRLISCDSRLWSCVSLRPEISGLHVTNVESLLALISIRFGPSLKYIELPMDLITNTVLYELSNKCPNLTHMLLDFSTAMQLHDFNDLQSFPTKLITLCICLSEVIFMEGFMRKIYNFINGIEVLHLVGTYEKAVEDEEEEIYEVINIHKLKSVVPNLRVVNLYGINFVDDSHVEAFSSNCIQLECLAINFCTKFTGSSLKLLFQRCKKLKVLLMQHTGLKNEHVMAVEWEKTNIQELDITAAELSSECLIDLLKRIQSLRYLSAGQQDGFNDLVMREYMEQGNVRNLIAFDVDGNTNLSEEIIMQFLMLQGQYLLGLRLSGIPHITEQFWTSVTPLLKNMRILVMGMIEGCCQKVQSKIHIDALIDVIANHCPHMERLECRWSPETIRFSDRSSKAIDSIRIRCQRLCNLVLSDGNYFEMVKSNFERADRFTVVRSITTNASKIIASDFIFNFISIVHIIRRQKNGLHIDK